jgi:hypothetical protein
LEIQVHLPRPHAKQKKFLRSKAKRVVVKAGRRGGKTVGVTILAVEKFLAGKRVLYATPTQDQIDRFWSGVTAALAEGIDNKVFYKNETRHLVELPGTEQRIRAKTAWDADSLRGDYADVLILDEFQLMNEDAWGVVGAPMLLDNDGDAYFVFTPPSFRTAGVSKAKDKRHANKMFKRAQNDKKGRWEAFHFTSHDNPHISRQALSDLTEDMSALAILQEIEAQDVEEVPGALWKRKTLDDYRRMPQDVPEFRKIVVAVDPKTEATASSETGIVVCALGTDKHGYLMDDLSLNSLPEAWAQKVVDAYTTYEANLVVAEINQGGDLVVSNVHSVQKGIPVTKVRATRGKYTRAEPISTLYSKGLIHHVGFFAELEEQMCSWVPGDASPDRLDAMVWGFTELLVGGRSGWSRGATG